MIEIVAFISLILSLAPALGNENVCLKPECDERSETMSLKTNLNVDPCVDFYKFSCNNYNASTTYADELQSHWIRAMTEYIDHTEVKPQIGLVGKFIDKITQCEKNTTDLQRCLSQELNTFSGLVGDVAILNYHAAKIHSKDARKIADAVTKAFVKLPFGTIPSETNTMRILRNHSHVVLVSPETLPTIQHLTRIFEEPATDTLEKLVREAPVRPKWVPKGFFNLTHVEYYPKYAFIGEFAHLKCFHLCQSITVMYPAYFSSPAYHPEWPESIKFGSFGWQVATALVQNILRSDEQRFKEIWSCFYEDQKLTKAGISDFSVFFPSYLQAFYTRQGINITASILGLEIAFRAYRNHLNKTAGPPVGLASKAAGRHYDNQFFISAAQNYCFRGLAGEKGESFFDPYPSYFLVNHAVMNNRNFHKTFHCREGAPMRPAKVCINQASDGSDAGAPLAFL